MRRANTVMLVGIFTILTLGGCKRTVASCDRRANGSNTCTEVLGSRQDPEEHDCTSSPEATKRGTWAKQACDRDHVIGACESNEDRTWYYPGGRVSKVEHIAALCKSGKVVRSDGVWVQNLSPEEPPAPRPTDPGLMALGAPFKAQLDANVAAIAKINVASGGPTGTVRLTDGKHVMAGPTTTAIWDRELVDFTEAGEPGHPGYYTTPDRDRLRACGVGWKLQDREGRTDAVMKDIFAWCAGLTTLAVITSSELDRPARGASFDPHLGKITGAILLYELPSGRLAGGYTFHAESTPKVTIDEVYADFITNLQKALNAGLTTADPGATFTFTITASERKL